VTARNYNNTAIPVTLSVGVNATAVTFTVPSTSGYPPAPFTIGVERGTGNEEVCLVTAKTSTQFTVSRGYDGTTGVAHLAGIAIEHCVAAIDYTEANFHINDQTHDQHGQYLRRDVLTTKGDIYVRTASGIVRLAIGADGQVLTADAASTGGMKWSTLSFLASGVIWLYGGTTAPTGWLFCDGSTQSRTTYANLFAVVGTAFATGGEAGTDFRLPDFRGRVAMGVGQGSGLTLRALAARGGEENHLLITSEMPSHTHTQNSHSHSILAAQAGNFSPAPFGGGNGNALSNGSTQSTTATNNNTGGGGSHNNLQPYLVSNFIIKT
jgi:microcystin-dependent protein